MPGSLSSELQTRYLSESDKGINDHLSPVKKPAPPLPLRPESLIFEITSLFEILLLTIFFHASYPPCLT